VPHQLCQSHSLKDGAQPVCEADRHFKKELNKKVRGSRDIERQAEQSLTKEAQRVADSSLALRTVMRDEGKYPLDPPGVPLYQKLPLMAASVERVKAAHPSALLKRRSRMLAVLNLLQKEYEQFVMFCSWIHQLAPLLHVQTSGQEAQAQLLGFIQKLQHSSLPTELLRVVPYVEKITVAFAPHLFDSLKQPLLPRTNNALELCIGRLKKSRRHITGRKNTQEFILREGSAVAMLFGLPHPNHWVEAFSRVDSNDFHHTLNLLRQTDKRSQCWPARHDLGAFLASLEQP
jgi:hypothetical protein